MERARVRVGSAADALEEDTRHIFLTFFLGFWSLFFLGAPHKGKGAKEETARREESLIRARRSI